MKLTILNFNDNNNNNNNINIEEIQQSNVVMVKQFLHSMNIKG